MMRFSLMLLLAFAGAAILAYGAFMALAWMRGASVSPLPPQKTPKSLSSADIYDLTRSAVAVEGLAAGVFAGVYAYRKQRIEESASRRSDAEQLSSRYQDAADQLGSDKAAVRLAGVYALTRLAEDWPEQRQVCINVLCAYFRMHKEGGELPGGEREVRTTIIDVLLDHLSPNHPASWRGYDMSLRGSYIDLDLYMLDGLGDGFVDFSDAVFSNCRIVIDSHRDAELDVVNFERATFQNEVSVEIKGRYKSGSIDFDSAKLLSGQFDFSSIYIDGCMLRFDGAEFDGADVYFSGAHFSSGKAAFTKANFAKGRVDFSHAEFGPGVAEFGYARYGDAEVVFEDVEGEKPEGLPSAIWQPKNRPSPGGEQDHSTS